MNTPRTYKTHTQRVSAILRERIISGDIPSGTPLRQDALARELHVSRIPVREALLVLESQGLVTFEPHKGAVAGKLSLTQLQELFELRSLLESHLLAHAIAQFDTETLIKAEMLLEQGEHACGEMVTLAQFQALEQGFYDVLYREADQPMTLDMVSGLRAQCGRYLHMQPVEPADFTHMISACRQLLRHVQRGERNAACQLLADRLRACGRVLAEHLTARLPL